MTSKPCSLTSDMSISWWTYWWSIYDKHHFQQQYVQLNTIHDLVFTPCQQQPKQFLHKTHLGSNDSKINPPEHRNYTAPGIPKQ